MPGPDALEKIRTDIWSEQEKEQNFVSIEYDNIFRSMSNEYLSEKQKQKMCSYFRDT